MVNLHPGISLKSIANTNDLHFEETIVFITEYNAKGAMGFIVNKLFPRTLNELLEFKQAPAFPLYYGGPVGEEQLFFIHQRPDIIGGGTLISNAVYFGGDFKKVVKAITENILSSKDLQIFIGYCGWDAGQLEEEIGDGGWDVIEGIRNGADHLYMF